MKLSKIRGLAIVGVGALAGFAYYYFIGCNSGHCPIIGNPIVSTIYGGTLGLIIAGGLTTGKKETDKKVLKTQDSDNG